MTRAKEDQPTHSSDFLNETGRKPDRIRANEYFGPWVKPDELGDLSPELSLRLRSVSRVCGNSRRLPIKTARRLMGEPVENQPESFPEPLPEKTKAEEPEREKITICEHWKRRKRSGNRRGPGSYRRNKSKKN